MSPSDKIMAESNSKGGDEEDQKGSPAMDNAPGLSSTSASVVTIPGTVSSIPLITASLPTSKCSINYQMKAFDPGKESSNERLTSNHCGNPVLAVKSSCSGLIKNCNRNYKAGSKINKLADMLAKRSLNLVEATQNNSSDTVSDISLTSKTENTVTLTNVSDVTDFGNSLNSTIVGFDKTANGKELDVFRKSRRKSVPNQSCNLNQLHIQSTSKSCLDFSKLFSMEDVKPEINALGELMNKLQTDESTKRKSIRKNLKNVELTQLLPEKKRRFCTCNENHINKINEKILEECTEIDGPTGGEKKTSKKVNEVAVSEAASPVCSGGNETNTKRETKTRQRRSKRLVETSTQTADIEFITVIKPEFEGEASAAQETKPSNAAGECINCSQSFLLEEESKGHKNSKIQIKCQYCSRKLSSVSELKLHHVKKHLDKCVNCLKCTEGRAATEQNANQVKEINLGKQTMEETSEHENKRDEKQLDRTRTKQNSNKTDLKVDVSSETGKKSSISPRSMQSKEIKTEEQLLEMEMLFYSHLPGNIQENLANHLDGKMDKNKCSTCTDKSSQPASESASSKVKGVNQLSVATSGSGAPDVQTSRAPSPYRTRSKTPNPLPTTAKKFKKLPNWQQKFWEKYNFPTNYRYEHRFWDKNYLNTEKSALYLKDLSCLDIKTQLTLKENVKKLENVKLIEEQTKPTITLTFPEYLSLVPRTRNETGQEKFDVPESSSVSRGQKPNRKEKDGTKKYTKPSATELPIGKTRKDAGPEFKKQTDRAGVEGGKMMTRRQNSAEQMKEDAEESLRKRKGSLDLTCGQKMVLRRQASVDSLQKNSNCNPEKCDRLLNIGLTGSGSTTPPLSPTSVTEISGEWVKPRSYLCGTCCTKFTNLWELEDHKWVSHPNVWCTHYEFEDEKIDKLFQINDVDGKEINLNDMSNVKLADLYKRYLLPHGFLKTAKLVPNTNFPEQCTKCKKSCANLSEMHKHMLDCGGDTTWFLTMYSSPMTMKRKWRPFGSRRRKLGRRDLKRSIPNSANLRPYHYQHRIRTKPGDVESIQKMLANLPEKRARRAINFDEIKTRSQATIHSNRLLRKRFKSSFASSLLKLKTLKQRRQLKSGKKEGSSKSTTDTSSESTPIGSPKRRNKLKENTQRESTDDSFNESSNDCVISTKKEGNQGKKNEFALPSAHQKKEGKKNKNKTKKKKTEENKISKPEKPLTRSNSSSSPSQLDRARRKLERVAQESPGSGYNFGGASSDEKDAPKAGKKWRKKADDCDDEFSENELLVAEKSSAKVKKESVLKKTSNIKVKNNGSGNVEKETDEPLQSNILLRLRHNTKDKTDLVKRMQKKLKNSKRVLEYLKETKKDQIENRRSLRLKSQQGTEDTDGNSGVQLANLGKINEMQNLSEIILKVKKSTSSSETPDRAKAKSGPSGKSLKTTPEKKCGKEVSELKDIKEEKEVSNAHLGVRRSSRSTPMRKSISTEENLDKTCQEVADKNVMIIRRNSKNFYDTKESLTTQKPISKRSPRRQQHEVKSDGTLNRQQVSPELSKKLCQSSRSTRGKEKSATSQRETTDTNNRNSDLEEMPILAKVEPIAGKFLRKKEQAIPVLMPVVDEKRERKETSSIEEKKMATMSETSNAISFQIVKRRRKTSQEVAPLKIIKKVDHTQEQSGAQVRKRSEEKTLGCNGALMDVSFDSGRSKRKEFESRPCQLPETKRYKSSSTNKYFLGISPCEIDKGREEVINDESGSDSEPLITLINQSQRSNIANSLTFGSKKNNVTIEETTVEDDKKPEDPEMEFKECKPKDDDVPTTEVEKIPFVTKSDEPSPDIVDVGASICQEKQKIKKKSKSKMGKVRESSEEASSEEIQENRESNGKHEEISATLENDVPEVNTAPPSQPANTDNKPQNVSCHSNLKEVSASERKESSLPERRSRRISKEIKSTSDFVIDDPLILVDELWSDLDSDSDSSRRRARKNKKKTTKKKCSDEKKMSDVNLEELLRNFGEKKNDLPAVKVFGKIRGKVPRKIDVRKVLENRLEQKSFRRLSLKLFRFNKPMKNFGNRGIRLLEVKKILRGQQEQLKAGKQKLPDLPFLAAEIKENPVQVIQCRSQKPKSVKKGIKLPDVKYRVGLGMQFKISLPLESISNIAVFNNNHLTELDIEKQTPRGSPAEEDEKASEEKEMLSERDNLTGGQEEIPENGEIKNKVKRSEVIDKIFYCEICQTYYYSSSQLKIHKLSNRHKLKEADMLSQSEKLEGQELGEKEDQPEEPLVGEECEPPLDEPKHGTKNLCELEEEKIGDYDRQNEDTLEMPILEGPFIENSQVQSGMENTEPSTLQPEPQPPCAFGFSPESLKDIQRAIGCTDEEMLILTLLGENTMELENDILDLDSCKSTPAKADAPTPEKVKPEVEKPNGIIKVDLKQRMTSALACLVNKAVINLLQKYESVAKSSVNPEAVSLLGKLSNLSRRKNILQLNELLKKQTDGESSVGTYQEAEKKEPTISYKYQCTICGSRFEKASTRECHISRSHKGKAKKMAEEMQSTQATPEEDWNDYWSYDTGDISLGSGSQFWCSDCGINFVSPKEVLEHQKVEHQTGSKESDRVQEAEPLQSSTIGSSDEIIEGKKSKRRPKVFSSEELDQQRIIANNELRKLDRKFTGKSKTSKIKWGMDALRFTVEKENKMVVVQEEKVDVKKEEETPQPDLKNIDLVPKLNFTRTSNIPEFKIIQKNSLKNRFQKIIDNKLKRKGGRNQQEHETDEMETEVMLVPVVVKKKKSKKQKSFKSANKSEGEKSLDVYDFNESESDVEPVTLSHIKKPMSVQTKLKLVRVKEGPSKNKADSTTKDLIPDDYDSEDSLPLSIVKKSKPEGEEDDEKDEKTSEDSIEKSEGILEQVEYLIEQLENETASAENKREPNETNNVNKIDVPEGKTKEPTMDKEKEEELKGEEPVDVPQQSHRVSLASKLLELQNLTLKNQKSSDKDVEAGSSVLEENESMARMLGEPECSQSTFDEEDSMPLVLMSRRPEELGPGDDQKKCDEATLDVSTSASEDVNLFSKKESNYSSTSDSRLMPEEEENARPPFCLEEKSDTKPFKTVNGNVIYCRNESMSNFDSEFSDDGLISSNYEKFSQPQETVKNIVNEVTEKEDIVIVCSKSEKQTSGGSKVKRKCSNPGQKKRRENPKSLKKKKKRFPLLTATIEDHSFRKVDNSQSNKEVIVRKIWNRPRVFGEDALEEDSSYSGNSNTLENLHGNDESQTEIEKEIIVNKIWSRKKVDYESEFFEKSDGKFEDLKINKTEISHEVVIKCGPKPATSPKRRKSKSSTSESSKETIMRKIWSGKCMFQTKAALKTYDSDVLPGDASQGQVKPRKRGRPSGLSSTKRVKSDDVDKNDEDDLDSLLEEIEREQFEKAIRLEFLQLRRSEKGNVEISKEGTQQQTMGLFTETSARYKRDASERKKKKKIRRNIRHPRQSLLKRKTFIKKPMRRILSSESKCVMEKSNAGGSVEQNDNLRDKQGETFGAVESKVKNRKHKKHRHKHHHHKHKHKKSRHHRCLVSKHKSKHKADGGTRDDDEEDECLLESAEGVKEGKSFTLLEKICQEMPSQMESESHQTGRLLSPVGFEKANRAEDRDEVTNSPEPKEKLQENVYEFAEDGSDLSSDGYKSKN